jgi:1,2-diacylglycerol 3-alpha-glucosyltransferase
MRIAIFAESHLPYLSGVTVSTDALARGLRARGNEVLVVAPRPSSGMIVELAGAGSPGPAPDHAWLPSYQLPRPVPPGYRMPWPLRGSAGIAAARAFRPDIVHAQSPFVTGQLARRLARELEIPLVFTHHTRFADYRHYLGPLAAPGAALTSAYLRAFWAGCAAVVAPSTDLADEIRARLGRRPRPIVLVIPTGTDVAGIAALEPLDPRPLAGWPADSIVVASLGRLASEKSVETVVDAFALAGADAPTLRLLLIGGGPSEPLLRRRAGEPGLSGRLHLTGQRPRLEALALLRGADVFAFASRTETQGLVLAEALASGLPAVALDGPGVRDSVRDGVDGRVIPADPAEGRAARLAAAITELAADSPARAAMAGRAAAGAGRFDLGVRIGEMEDLYRELIDLAG